jgi:uncharacterized protein YggE
MRMRMFIALFLFSALALKADEAPNTLVVTADGNASADPTHSAVTINVQSYGYPDQDSAYKGNAAVAEQVATVLSEFGDKSKEFDPNPQASGPILSIATDRDKDKTVIATSYAVQNSITILVPADEHATIAQSRFAKIDAMYKKLMAIKTNLPDRKSGVGATWLDFPGATGRLDNRTSESIQDIAEDDALAKATARAKKRALACKIKYITFRSIEQLEGYDFRATANLASPRMMDSEAGAPVAPITLSKLNYTAKFRVTFTFVAPASLDCSAK